MDFFRAQELARRRTWQLVALFAAAVAALILATNLLIALVVAFSATPGWVSGVSAVIESMSPGMWLTISALVLFTIAAASFYKFRRLRSGGRAVAEGLGGRQVNPATRDANERRLLNVVEEMAIATGTPVPPVYVLEEPCINAFAAGLGMQDAIVGVTRGCIEHLDRDELQGVIGHEFSHILNGDTRINLRLVCLLHGILFLGLLGEVLLRGGRVRRHRDRHALAFAGLGIGLWAIGYAGTFFGNLIKAAVNRQREYLADASAVQFTRNPGGIVSALEKIGGATLGSHLTTPRAREVSHFFFSQAVSFAIEGLFSTHPPLEQRIRAIQPDWDGQFVAVAAEATPLTLPETATAAVDDPIIRQVGQLSNASLPIARARIDGLPAEALAAAHDPSAAFALVTALFLSRNPKIREQQATELSASEDPVLAQDAVRLFLTILDCDPVERLTLITLAAPALKMLSTPQYQRLMANVRRLASSDASIDLNEWVLHRILHGELAPHFGGSVAPRGRMGSAADADAAMSILLSSITRATQKAPSDHERAFAAGARTWPTSGPSSEPAPGHSLQYDGSDDPNFERLNRALRVLRAFPPLQKPRIIKACAACALVDGASAPERALLAGIAAALDCPLPPDFQTTEPHARSAG